VKTLRILLTLFALYVPAIRAETGGAHKPNFLIVMADDLDTHELSCYGGKNLRTPHIDRLASEGMLFTHMFTPQAMCVPTRTAIYTGLHPMRSGAVRNGAQTRKDVKSVVHHLTELGYRVGIAGKVHVHPRQVYPFEYVEGFPKGSQRKAEDETYQTRNVREFMLRDSSQPFCLFVCSTLPHAAYVVGDPTPFEASQLILQKHWIDTPQTREEFRRYLAEIAALDQQVGDLLKVLHDTQLEGKTLTLFSGEQGSAFPGAKWSCYNAGVRSGFIARLPGAIPAGTTTHAIAMCEDILPTLIEMAGVSPKTQDLDGRSLTPVLSGAATSHRDCAMGMLNMRPDGKPFASRFIVNHQYKLILNLTPENEYTSPTVNPTAGLWRTWMKASLDSKRDQALLSRISHRPAVQMFDLQKDPSELHNIAEDSTLQPFRESLEKKLREWMRQQGDPGAGLEN
jgi:N-sulfoglucosamine sulfohydrolase